MRISLPFVCIGDSPVRFISYSLHNGNFTISNHIKVTDDVNSTQQRTTDAGV